MDKHPHDNRSPEEILKARRMLISIFGLATLFPALWMFLMAYNGITAGQGEDRTFVGFSSVLIYWGLAGPVVWAGCNWMAFVRINRGDSAGAQYFPLIPAFWAIIWFAAQVTG